MSYQRGISSQKWLHIVFGIYVLSYTMPAVVLAGDTMYGFMAAVLCFDGLGGGLEKGQTPACYFGAVANLSYVAGYAAHLLQRIAGRRSISYRPSFFLAALAAICAIGSALALAMGSESFYPTFGYFVWVGSMAAMAVILHKLNTDGRVQEKQDP